MKLHGILNIIDTTEASGTVHTIVLLKILIKFMKHTP
jgi:hypothetical protein